MLIRSEQLFNYRLDIISMNASELRTFAKSPKSRVLLKV